MNKKGEINVAVIILIAISIIVGAVLLQGSAQQLSPSVNTVTVLEHPLTFVANGTAIVIPNYRTITGVTIQNASNNVLVVAGNYTVTNEVVSNGALVATVTPDASASVKYNWEINFTGQPSGYINETGARSIAGLIIVFGALAILATIMIPILREKGVLG